MVLGIGTARSVDWIGRWLPAIAIPVGVDPAERDAKPTRFPTTIRAFTGAAQFAVKLIGNLQENRPGHGELLPGGTILNVNYPAADPEDINGVRIVPATSSVGFEIDYEDSEQDV